MGLSIAGSSDFFFGKISRSDQVVVGHEHEPPLLELIARTRQRLRRASHRGAPHCLLADSGGAWSWSPTDLHAPATRHAGVPQWMEANPGRNLRVWLSADLTRCGDRMEMQTLKAAGDRHDVRMQSVSPWWQHAFVHAKRCAHILNRASRAQVGVVEGTRVTWIVTETGVPREIHSDTLDSATIGALRDAIDCLRPATVTVVLGQGLIDGKQTQALNAHVLGRLDGHQPPQWLRPDAEAAIA